MCWLFPRCSMKVFDSWLTLTVAASNKVYKLCLSLKHYLQLIWDSFWSSQLTDVTKYTGIIRRIRQSNANAGVRCWKLFNIAGNIALSDHYFLSFSHSPSLILFLSCFCLQFIFLLSFFSPSISFCMPFFLPLCQLSLPSHSHGASFSSLILRNISPTWLKGQN